MSISRREMWFDFFPTTLITSSSIPGPRDRGCWIGNLRRWETMILTNWWSGLVENRCWHPTSQHAVLWFISHKRLMAASSQEASFFLKRRRACLCQLFLVSLFRVCECTAAELELANAKYIRKEQPGFTPMNGAKSAIPEKLKAREWGQSLSSFWNLMFFKGLTLPQRKHVVWWKARAWEAKRPRS